MALFGKKKKEEEAPKAATPVKAVKKEVAVSTLLPDNPGAILIRPRLTEKAALLSESGVYAFEVNPKATKKEVSKAVAAVFKVTPVSVRFVRIPRKEAMTRQTGKAGMTRGGKKAYVALKEGDKIELV